MRTVIALFLFTAAMLAQTTDTAPRKLATIPFASLGTASPGLIASCSDCKQTNPCEGSGTGALARVENGAWNCGGGTGTGAITVKVNGGAQEGATGFDTKDSDTISWTSSMTGTVVNLVPEVNAGMVLPPATAQKLDPWKCVSASSSATTYTCSLNPALTTYGTTSANRVSVLWVPDVACTGGVATTLNINGVGAAGIKKSDGTTDPAASDCTAGKPMWLHYDGTVFRIGGGGSGTAEPALKNSAFSMIWLPKEPPDNVATAYWNNNNVPSPIANYIDFYTFTLDTPIELTTDSKVVSLITTENTSSCGGSTTNCGLLASLYPATQWNSATPSFVNPLVSFRASGAALNTKYNGLLTVDTAVRLERGTYVLATTSDSNTVKMASVLQGTDFMVRSYTLAGQVRRGFCGTTVSTGNGASLAWPSTCANKTAYGNGSMPSMPLLLVIP